MILQDQTPMEEVGIPEEGATLDGGGNPGNPPPDGDHGSNWLKGNKPEVFDGDWSKVEGFMTKWKIYYGLNQWTWTMHNPLERALIFLGYVWGPQVDKWVDDQIQETHKYIRNNVGPNCNWHKHI